jgi:hypothetical protein
MRAALLDFVLGLAMYLTIMVGDSFDSCTQCANCRDALVHHFTVQGELIHRIFLEAAQAAKLANHHQVSRGVDGFAKSASAYELTNAHPGKVGLIAKLLTLCRRQSHFKS